MVRPYFILVWIMIVGPVSLLGGGGISMLCCPWASLPVVVGWSAILVDVAVLMARSPGRRGRLAPGA